MIAPMTQLPDVIEDLNHLVSAHRWAGTLSAPVGLIFHSTRSGQQYTHEQEYKSACNHARSNVQRDEYGALWYLGWHVTVSDHKYAVHIPANHYGWNAGSISSVRIAYEFVQSNRGDPITDEQIEAACAYTRRRVKTAWPSLYRSLDESMIVEHWQTEQGRRYGKTDVDPDHPGELARRFIRELRR